MERNPNLGNFLLKLQLKSCSKYNTVGKTKEHHGFANNNYFLQQVQQILLSLPTFTTNNKREREALYS